MVNNRNLNMLLKYEHNFSPNGNTPPQDLNNWMNNLTEPCLILGGLC